MGKLDFYELNLVLDPLSHHTIEIVNERGPVDMPELLETNTYARKRFLIQEVQVTASNMETVAKWVDGEIHSDSLGDYIQVRVHRPANPRQTKAYATDHVLYAGTGFKVYSDKAFKNAFEKASEETVMVDISKSKKRVGATTSRKEIENDEIERVIENNVVVPKRVAKKAAKSA